MSTCIKDEIHLDIEDESLKETLIPPVEDFIQEGFVQLKPKPVDEES